MATTTEDKSKWILPPLPEDIRAFRREAQQFNADVNDWHGRQRQERRLASEAFRKSITATSERWKAFWNKETL